MAVQNEDAELPKDADDHYMDGRKLSETEAAKLEQKLLKKPGDMKARCRLLGYYSNGRYTDEAFNKKYEQHALWVIEHHPLHEIHKHGPQVSLHAGLNSDAYAVAKRMWLEHIEADGNNLALLRHAANFFTINDRKVAINLLRKTRSLDPLNPDVANKLAHVYYLDDQYSLALEEQEISNKLEPEECTYSLERLAKYALAANNLEKATAYAERLKAIALDQPEHDRVASILHTAHTILGLISLRSEDIDSAQENLLLSFVSATDDSYPMSWVTREMRELLQGLLDRGRREPVLAFLKNILKTCYSRRRNERWISEISDGLLPDLSDDQPYSKDDNEYVSGERFWSERLSQLDSARRNNSYCGGPHTSLWRLLMSCAGTIDSEESANVLLALEAVPIAAQRLFAFQFTNRFVFSEHFPYDAMANCIVFDTISEPIRMVSVLHKSLPASELYPFMENSVVMVKDPDKCLYPRGSPQQNRTRRSNENISRGPFLVIAIDLTGNNHLCRLIPLED